jgi:PAS domain S-box-containing protein
MENAPMGTHSRCRILHLEDSADDAQLVRAVLESDRIPCEVRVVSTPETFRKALEQGGIDLILSDFNIPRYDGLSALKDARKLAPGIPFIFVSGALGEENAIDTLRSGATDYVLKDRLARLVPAVRRALEECAVLRQREQAEAELLRQQQFLSATLDSIETGIVACDAEGRLSLINRATQELHGIPSEDTAPAQWAEHFGLYHADGKTRLALEETPLHRALNGEHVRNIEVTIIPRGAEARTVLVSGQPIVDAAGGKLGAVIAIHDITDRKKLEVLLRQAQKMEAVGRLAGGVAHDFNNLLTAIIGYADLMRLKLAGDDAARRDLDEIAKAGARAADLTRQLLAFSRQQVLEPRVLDLNAIVTELDKMLRRLIGEDIDLSTVTATGLGRVKADPGQIEQVLMNLVVNARDAMPDGGKITIETADVDLDSGYTSGRVDLEPGRYVMLAVSDTGTGMDAEVRTRIFEPFYTTKPLGKGTGLGLSTVHGIVKQSGGHIEVYSEPGQGTTFKIYLPRIDEAASPAPARPVLDARSRGSETVLLVEDEDAIARVVRASLELQGYTVLQATDGSEAIATCERADQSIDLLITDVVMPLMSGPELVRRITTIRPDLKILYISGYTDRALVHQGLRDRGSAFLQKPFTPDTLARKVRDVLDAPRADAA